MKRKILVSITYNGYIEVSPQLLAQLIECPVYKQLYDNGYKYTLADDEHGIEIQVPRHTDFITDDPVTIDVNEIMAENNRLTRELELLKEKYKPLSDSKDLIVE
jgi:hypothetical protein